VLIAGKSGGGGGGGGGGVDKMGRMWKSTLAGEAESLCLIKVGWVGVGEGEEVRSGGWRGWDSASSFDRLVGVRGKKRSILGSLYSY